jgi:DNA-directed RNA polymerase specialized sigma24 family protein
MAAAQDGDRQAYRRVLNVVVERALTACAQDETAQQVDAFLERVLLTVHRALPTFEPKRSFGVWLDAIIAARLT